MVGEIEFENKSYLLSIVLLTRKNPKGVIETINNFTNCSNTDLDNYEFIVKVDYDDHDTIDLIKSLDNDHTNIKFIISSRLQGYPSMNEFQRDAAALARGKYIMCIGDDTKMTTSNWNEILQQKLTEFKFYYTNFNWVDLDGTIVNIKDAEEPEFAADRKYIQAGIGKNFHDFVYLIYPRKILELWGFISPHALTDQFLGEIGKRISMHPWDTPMYQFIDEVIINHHKSNSVSKSDSDKVYFTCLEYINDRLTYECINKLREYVEWEKWDSSHRLNVVNDFRDSGLSVKDYFKLK